MTRGTDRTQVMPRPVSQNPRVHLLDDMWLLTIVAIVVATGLPWIASGFEVDIGAASWGLLALGGIYITIAMLASPAQPQRWHGRAFIVLDVLGVALIGFIWQHVGALQNPMFLAVFALPVIGAIFLSRWQPFLIAAVSVLVVAFAALAQAPELRWYANGLLGGDQWLTWLFGAQSTAPPQPSFSGFYAPSSYLVVMLEVFTVALFACAVAAEYIGTIFERLQAHSRMARAEAERSQELWVTLIERLPLPALLIDPDTMQVIASSNFAAEYLEGEELPLEGRKVFDALRFSYPDLIHALIVGSGQGTPTTVIRVADQLRLAKVRVLQVAHNRRRMALMTIEDATEVFCLRAALEASEYAALVVDARGRVLAFNKLAVGLFGSVEVGTDAAQLLSQPAAGQRLWDPGLTARRKMHIEIGPRIYEATSSAIPIAGENESIYTVAFLPVARGSSSDPYGTNSTITTGTLRQLR